MVKHSFSDALQSVVRLIEVQSLRAASDHDLLRRFVVTGDEAAFRVIAERHGPMVLGVCARVLGCRHDAEDAFQATFLVFSRRAATIRQSASLASWLHGVARRVATKLRRDQRRRRDREALNQPPAPRSPVEELTWAEVKTGLDEELELLPRTYREVLVLCYLEGQTRDEAAQRLGVEVGAVKGRLERGRKLLAARLAKRGLTLSAGLLTVAVSADSVSAAARAGALFAAGQSASAVVSPRVLSLANEVLKGTVMSNVKLIGASVVCSLILAAGVGLGLAQVPSTGGPTGDTTGGPGSGGSSASKPVEKDTDEGYVRRVSMDLRGVEPTPTEVHFFVNSKDPNKRGTLVDLLLKERKEKAPKAGGDPDPRNRDLDNYRPAKDDPKARNKGANSFPQPGGSGDFDPSPGRPDTSAGRFGPGGGSSLPQATDHTLALLKIKVAEAELAVKEKLLLLDAAKDANKNLKGDERVKGDRQIDLLTIDLERAHLQLQEATLKLEAESRSRKEGKGPAK